jgi:hypothetical protein
MDDTPTKGGSGASGTGIAVQKAAGGMLTPDIVRELRSNVDVVFQLVGHAFGKDDRGAGIAGVIEDEQSAVIELLFQLCHLD